MFRGNLLSPFAPRKDVLSRSERRHFAKVSFERRAGRLSKVGTIRDREPKAPVAIPYGRRGGKAPGMAERPCSVTSLSGCRYEASVLALDSAAHSLTTGGNA